MSIGPGTSSTDGYVGWPSMRPSFGLIAITVYPRLANARSALLPNLPRSFDAPMTATVLAIRESYRGSVVGSRDPEAIRIPAVRFDLGLIRISSRVLSFNFRTRGRSHETRAPTRRYDRDMPSLADVLATRTADAAPELVRTIARGRIQCLACGHACPIPDGAMGVCKVRFNQGGTLRVPYGYVGGVQCDPIEKKPFFHARPGALAFSFGMLGCDLHCSYCQNWVTSQALRDPLAVAPPQDTTPHSLVQDALRQRAKIMVSTYNEPLITVEWAVAIFKEARRRGLVTGFVSNGNATPQVLAYIRPC